MSTLRETLFAAMGRIDPRLRLALMAAIVALIGWQSWVLLLNAPFARYRVVAASQRSTASIEDANAALAAQAQVLKDKIQALEQKVAEGSSRVTTDALLVELVARLEEMARRRGVKLDSVKPGASREVPLFAEMSFNVDVRGSYGALFEWLQDIESGLDVVSVKSFHVGATTDPAALTMALELAAYRRRGAEESRP